MDENTIYTLSQDEFVTAQVAISEMKRHEAILTFFLGHLCRANKIEGKYRLSEDGKQLVPHRE
jgi:hypothetical protein